MMFNKNKTKYVVYFVSCATGVYEVVRIKKINLNTESVSYFKDKDHIIDINSPTMKFNNLVIYVVDINQGFISLKSPDKPIDSGMVSRIVKQSIISQLTKSMERKTAWMELLMGILGGTGCGLFIGYILAGYV
jgi:hypothetical protein